MKFTISSTNWDIDELIEKYPVLNNFGFDVCSETIYPKRLLWDEKGHRIYQEIPTTVRVPYVHIYTLEELTTLRDAVDEELIISSTVDGYMIEIYDGYRE